MPPQPTALLDSDQETPLFGDFLSLLLFDYSVSILVFLVSKVCRLNPARLMRERPRLSRTNGLGVPVRLSAIRLTALVRANERTTRDNLPGVTTTARIKWGLSVSCSHWDEAQ
jgi:hypothetical protein